MIGIIGGAFDPVHFGHLRPALELSETLGLTRLHWVPTGIAAHRSAAIASGEQRAAMLRAALSEHGSEQNGAGPGVAREPALGTGGYGWVVDEREIRRPGPSYMVDTLLSLRKELDANEPLCLLLGMDAFLGLEGWHRWQEILDLCHLVVSHRPGWQLAAETLSPPLTQLLAEHQMTQVEALSQQPAGGIFFSAVSQLAISSSQIRALIASGRDARFLLPSAVLEIINQQQLYQS